MAKLSNSPKQALNFDLERRKSFTFRVRLKYSDGSLVNLTGCTLRFVMKSAGAVDDHFDLNNLVVNSEATIGSPTTGEGVFAFQAAELDGDPGEYGYSIVLWSPDNFSTVLAKGVINLLDNSESHSMHRLYSATAPTSALELTLRGGDVVEVEVVSLPQVPVSVDAISWPDVGGKPESFPPSTHGHTINEVTGLATELAGKQPVGNYAASVHQHTVSDVNGLQGALDGKSPTTHNHDGAYAPTTHDHTIAQVTGLQGALDAKAASSHGHTIAQVTGLQGALDGKQPAGSYAASTHTHTAANIADFTEATQDIVGSMVAGAGGTYNDAAGTITLPSGGGGGGGAVDSVAGRTGAVVLSSADLTDAASLATDAELTAGLAGKANSSHTHAAADITSGTIAAGRLPSASAAARGIVELATTAEATAGTDTQRAVTPAGLKAVADTKAASDHNHTASQVTDFTEATQDIIGAMVTGAGGTYDDAAGSITLPSGGGSDPWTYVMNSAATSNATGAYVNVNGLALTNLAVGTYEIQAIFFASDPNTAVHTKLVLTGATGSMIVQSGRGPNEISWNLKNGTSIGVEPNDTPSPNIAHTSARYYGLLTVSNATNSVVAAFKGQAATEVVCHAGSTIAYRRLT